MLTFYIEFEHINDIYNLNFYVVIVAMAILADATTALNYKIM